MSFNLRKLSVGRRAGLTFSLVGLMVLIMGAVSLYQSSRMDNATSQLRSSHLPTLIILANLSSDLGRARALTLSSVVYSDQEKKSKAISDATQLLADIEESAKKYGESILDAHAQKSYRTFASALIKYEDSQSEIVRTVRNDQLELAKQLIDTKLSTASTEVRKSLDGLISINSDAANQAADFSRNAFRSSIIIISCSMAAIVIALIIIAISLTRSIVTPLSNAVSIAHQVASGDLTNEIEAVGNDEPAQLLTALHTMQDNLRATIQKISETSDQLASASEELHAVTEDANVGLTKQNCEIDQAATAVNEMTAAVEEVANNAVSTADASAEANRNTHNGRLKVNEAVASIELLVGDVSTTSEKVKELAGNITKISQVLIVIRSIAEQTNLLALNAAIEAARAGEAGRGFAVVADEVRALAYRTQESTAEIEQMICEVQSGTASAVQAMELSQNRALDTVKVAQAANDALDIITSAINSINERNLVIASASEQQAQVAREVDRNLTNIRDLSMHTAAGANQTNAASQELSSLAVNLNSMINTFKV